MATKLLDNPFLDPSSTLIMVTGASGYIASNIIKEALDLGYKVRGTARTQEKCDRTVQEQGNNPNYSAVIVSDFSFPSPEIDASVIGVHSVIHVASDLTASADADKVISSVRQGTQNFLRAAAQEPTVKRFTLTSSSTAATCAKPGVEGIVLTADTWNTEAVTHATTKVGEGLGAVDYPFVVYAASKTVGEQSMWEFAKTEKPGFVVNSVLPNLTTGRIIGSPGATGAVIRQLYENKKQEAAWVLPQWYVDVVDVARLHLILAVLDEEIKDQRIFAFATPFNINDFIDAIKKVAPSAPAGLTKDPNEPRDLMQIPNEPGAKLLKKWYGQDGYKPLEQSVKENLGI